MLRKNTTETNCRKHFLAGVSKYVWLEAGGNTTLETQIIRKDGQIRDVVIKSNMIENNKRRILQGVFVDIADDKRTREQLKWAKEKAEEANIAKSQFLANMSHELRTPMNSVIGFSDLLSEEPLTEEQRDYVNTISSNGKHLLILISDILNFTKIDAGKLEIEMAGCSLESVLAKVQLLISDKGDKKGLEFSMNICKEMVPHLVTDPLRLSQCLVNLIDNAVKFTETGHVYLNVSSEDRDGQAYIRFDVEDTGIGISAEQQERIFESFVQGDGSTSRKYGGTGLGLTITKKLVELLGGQISVSSQVGKGSVFTITLPVHQETMSETINAVSLEVDQLNEFCSKDIAQPSPSNSALDDRELKSSS